MGNRQNMSTGPTTNAADQAAAGATRDAGKIGSSGSVDTLSGIERVAIDDGVQKYVLVVVTDDTGKEHHFVRGDVNASYFQTHFYTHSKHFFVFVCFLLYVYRYHNDAATPLVQELESKGIMYNVLGGGTFTYNFTFLKFYCRL